MYILHTKYKPTPFIASTSCVNSYSINIILFNNIETFCVGKPMISAFY